MRDEGGAHAVGVGEDHALQDLWWMLDMHGKQVGEWSERFRCYAAVCSGDAYRERRRDDDGVGRRQRGLQRR